MTVCLGDDWVLSRVEVMAPGDVVGLPLASCGLPLPYLGRAASAVELALALALHCQCSGKRQLETEFTTTALKVPDVKLSSSESLQMMN